MHSMSDHRYGSKNGILIDFSKNAGQKPDGVRIGDIDLVTADWPCGDDILPDEAAKALSDQVSAWLDDSSVHIDPYLPFQERHITSGPA